MKKIYITSIQELREEKEAYYLDYCDEKRRTETPKYRYVEDRLRSIAAGLLLQNAYIAYRKNKDNISFQNVKLIRNEDGKPYIKDEKGFYFSISHAKDYVIIAVADVEIGADIEKVVEGKAVEKLAKRFFAQNEYETLISMQDDQKDKYFTEIWTMKESYIKYLGTGLKYGLNSFQRQKDGSIKDEKRINSKQIIYTQSVKYQEHYIISLCSTLEQMPDQVEYISIDEMMQSLQMGRVVD